MGSVLTKKRADGKKDLPLWSPAFSTVGRALRYRTKNLLALRLEHEPGASTISKVTSSPRR
jgi:hypothetical protein